MMSRHGKLAFGFHGQCVCKIVDMPPKLVFENCLYDVGSDLSVLVSLQRFTPKRFCGYLLACLQLCFVCRFLIMHGSFYYA